MAITDQQYQDWLRGDNGLRVVLVEVEAYSGGTVTRAMSNVPFVSEPGDAPATTIYDDIVLSVPQYKSVMGEQNGSDDIAPSALARSASSAVGAGVTWSMRISCGATL